MARAFLNHQHIATSPPTYTIIIIIIIVVVIITLDHHGENGIRAVNQD
jgi:hypothetical protein